MTFTARLEIGKLHELRVLESLIRRGWDAEYFGQAMLSERMREYLRKIPTCVRWMPDIIAAKNITGKNLVAFVDAKGGKKYQETGNHDIETASLVAAEKWIELSGDECPYYYVFDDGTVATPGDVREHGHDGMFRGNGSGTPFKLLPCTKTRTFDSAFGEKVSELDD